MSTPPNIKPGVTAWDLASASPVPTRRKSSVDSSRSAHAHAVAAAVQDLLLSSSPGNLNNTVVGQRRASLNLEKSSSDNSPSTSPSLPPRPPLATSTGTGTGSGGGSASSSPVLPGRRSSFGVSSSFSSHVRSASSSPRVSRSSGCWRRTNNNTEMQLKIFRHTWGLDQVSLSSFFSNLRATDKPYQGVEAGLIWLNQSQREELKQVIEEQRFDWIAMVFTDTPMCYTYSVSSHVAEFERQVAEALSFSSVLPTLINVHGGRDGWPREQQEHYFTQVLAIAAKLPVPVVHETHRGRILYNPWTTRDLLQKFPTLELCADLSHWTCVAERMLHTEECFDILRLVAIRTRHIHARVGHEQSPQVSDPRAPEWATHVATFERWWESIWKECGNRGDRACTATPEYGPNPYQSLLPYTQQPVANLNDIVDWAAHRLQQRFRQEKLEEHVKVL